MLRSAFFLVVLSTAAWSDAAQQTQGVSSFNISARIGGNTYQAAGQGTCRHAPTASIYDVPAALWMVEYAGSHDARIRRLNLTLWRPKDGSADQVSLALETSSAAHRINSVGKSPPAGGATVRLVPLGAGGRFDLKGKDADGTNMELTVYCPAFAGLQAEGG